MKIDFKQRHAIAELMDQPGCDKSEFFRTLDELDWINQWLGGYSVSLRGIQAMLPKSAAAFRVMDIGCGGGELSSSLLRWAKRNGRCVRYLGVDHNPLAIEYAGKKHPDHEKIEFICEDLYRLDTAHRVEIVHAALCLHHFHHHEAVRAVKRMYDLCTYGVVINDLHRHPLSYYSIQYLTALASRSKMIRHDAPASVLNGFQLSDLHDLVSRAGLPDPKISWRWGFRWLILIPKRSEVNIQERVRQSDGMIAKSV